MKIHISNYFRNPVYVTGIRLYSRLRHYTTVAGATATTISEADTSLRVVPSFFNSFPPTRTVAGATNRNAIVAYVAVTN